MEHILEQAREGTPIIDGESVTFVWHGDQAPQLIGDMTDWEWGSGPLPLSEVAPQVWARTLTLPTDTYMEYAFWDGEDRVADPLNRNITTNGMGHKLHYFYMPKAKPTPLTRRRRKVPRGTLTRHVVKNEWALVGGKRPVYLYQPPTGDPCPLLVVLDGQDYLRQGRIINIAENLIHQGRIRPIALALPYHAGQARGVEYSCSATTVGLISEILLPLAQAELSLLPIKANPGAYGILGASMGGLQALYTGLRRPDIFGHVISQSGAFSSGDHEHVVWDLLRHCPRAPIRIWMDVGRFEWLLPANRDMHKLLVEKGYDVAYREFSAGHNYTAWRNDLWRALEHFYPLSSAQIPSPKQELGERGESSR
jgi:enterochelin esterase family protein